MTVTTPVQANPLTARVLWWLSMRTHPIGPAEGQELLALIHDLEANPNP